MKKLKLSNDLQLPAEEIAESAIGLIAKRGRGKSGVLKILMEEMSAAGVPFVMFDPVGIAYGLRSSFDGKTPSGIEVLVVGGPHADVRLELMPAAAARHVGNKHKHLLPAEQVALVKFLGGLD